MKWEPRYCYVITRKDLSNSQRAVQAIHAAIEATRNGLIPLEIEHPHVVYCHLPNEDELKLFREKLVNSEIRFKEFIEPDRNFELTALATEPVGTLERVLFQHLKLL